MTEALSERVAVVTGAGGLLGRQHCLALARAGATVVAVDLDRELIDGVVEGLHAQGYPSALAIGADIADSAGVAFLRDEVLARFKRVDVLVNNAALDEKLTDDRDASGLRFESHPLALWEQALRVNVTGAFLCCQALGSEMARVGRGSIVNVASTYGLVAPDQSLYRDPDGRQAFWKSAAYPTTKAALIGLTRHLAAYWGERGVRVNALAPGGVKNGQPEWFVDAYARRTPLGRMASPGDYAGALLFLASDASAYMTGATLVVDGGYTAW